MLFQHNLLVQLGNIDVANIFQFKLRHCLLQKTTSKMFSVPFLLQRQMFALVTKPLGLNSATRIASRPFSVSALRNRHFKISQQKDKDDYWDNPMGNPVYKPEELLGVKKIHIEPTTATDKLALFAVKTLRLSFDVFSGYIIGTLNTQKVLRRAIFLETVAGVPGFAAAMLRHLSSLRNMKRDHGWIFTLLNEAENERMHLLTFMKLHRPGPIFRLAVLVTQGLFMNGFFIAYIISPRFCHRFVGYLEEEAVKTYSHILQEIDDGRLEEFKVKPAPQIAKDYWKLSPDATCRDLILVVRADESHHRDANHVFASIPKDSTNPFIEKKQTHGPDQ